jgi:hypothetical protein
VVAKAKPKTTSVVLVKRMLISYVVALREEYFRCADLAQEI